MNFSGATTPRHEVTVKKRYAHFGGHRPVIVMTVLTMPRQHGFETIRAPHPEAQKLRTRR
jgi:hypothetical protein